MANALKFAQLQNAGQMITAGNLNGFYEYMESQGYNYAYRAEGVIDQDTLAGSEAYNYLILSAQQQGVTLTSAQITSIESDLATAWLTALENVAEAQGTVSSDLDFQTTLDFHRQVFSDFHLQPTAWTLYIPSKVLGSQAIEQIWENFLSVSAPSFVNDAKEVILENNLIALMSFYAAGADFLPANPALQAQAWQWLQNTVGEIIPDAQNTLTMKALTSKGFLPAMSGELALLLSGTRAAASLGESTLSYLNGTLDGLDSNANQITSDYVHLGQNVNIDALATQLTSAAISVASTQSGSSTDPAIIADAKANAGAYQQLLNQWLTTLQGLMVSGDTSSADIVTTDSSGNQTNTLEGWNATAGTAYQQITTTQTSGAVSADISGVGDVATLSNATITIESDTTATIIGSGNTLSLGGNDTLTLSAGNTFNTSSGTNLSTDTITLNVASGNSITIDAGTYFSLQANASSPTVDVTLATPLGISLGTLTFNTSTNADSFTFADGMVITLPGITNNVVALPTTPNASPLQILSTYLGDLGDALSTSALSTLNFNYLNPTGTAYTVSPESTVENEAHTDVTVTYYVTGAPGAVVAGQSTGVGFSGTLPAINVLLASGDLSQDAISNVQTLTVAGNVAVTSAQFNGFSTVNDSSNGSIAVTTGGTDSLANATGTIGLFYATGWDGTTLIGNNDAEQTLEASLFGNDTLEAGSGARDYLIAGEGVDTLIGGSGGDYFTATNGLAAGSVLTGNGTGNTLEASGDISQASITGIQTLALSSSSSTIASITLNATEFNSFTTFDLSEFRLADVALIASTGGTYNLTGKSVTNLASITATSSDATTIIGDGTFIASGTGNDTLTGNNAAYDTLSATGNGNDTLTAGTGAYDTLTATGDGNDTLSAGGGDNDTLSATGAGNDTLTAGGGDYDTLSATGTGSDTLTSGDGNNDTLTASNGTDTLTAGDGNNDTLTVTTGGNTLTAGSGTGDVLTAKGGDNTLSGGSGGDTFNIYDDDNTATGGSGNDTFNLKGASSGSGTGAIDLAGTTIDGGGGVNTLNAGTNSLDISQATITNIQSITASSVTVSASELAELTTINASFVYTASAGDYTLASTGAVTLEDDASGGGTTLTGNNSADEALYTTQTGDTLVSGTGTNDFLDVSGTGDSATANGSDATVNVFNNGNTVTANGTDVAVTFLTAKANTATLSGAGDTVTLEDSSNGNTVFVQSAGDTVNDITTGGNTFVVGGGSATGATLEGSDYGSDSYQFTSNFGQDTITLSSYTHAAEGEISFGSGITDQNLWFQQVGNNLQIDLMGTNETVTVTNWFNGTSDQVQSIILSNGTQLTNTQVAALVSAMATYATANPSFSPSSVSSIPSNTTLQSAVTTAWASSVTITDSAANVAVELDTLQTLAANGQLAAITLTNSGTPTLAVTATQLTNDATALGKISGSYHLTVSGVLAANATSVAAQSAVTSLSVSDTAADVAANIDALQALSTKLTSITLTDTGTPVLDITATQLTNDASTLAKISGSYDLSVSNVLAANAATVAANTHVISLTVADSAANVTSNIAELETLALSDKLQLITLTNSGTPALSFTAAQVTSDVDALSLLSGTFTLAVSDTSADVVANLPALETLAEYGILTSIALTDSGTPTLSLNAYQVAEYANALSDITTSWQLAVSDSAADVSATIDSLEAFAANLSSITLTDTGTPTLSITATQLTNDAATLDKISGSYDLSVSDVLASNASTVAANSHVTSIAVLDTAANVVANIAVLETLVTDGLLTSVALSDSGTPTLTLTNAEVTADAGVLDAITTPYTVVIGSSYITAAQAAALAGQTGIVPVLVEDSAANIVTYLSDLQTLASDDELASITFTDSGTPVLAITAGMLSEDANALDTITGPYSLMVSDVAASNAATVASQANVLSLSVSDTAADVLTNIAALQTLAANGELTSIILTDSTTPTLSLTASQLTADATALGKISNAYSLAISGVTAANATTVAAESHVSSISISDSSANVVSNLAALQTLAASGEISSIALSDTGTPALSITDAQFNADATALNLISTPYTLSISAVSGTGNTLSLSDDEITLSTNASATVIGNDNSINANNNDTIAINNGKGNTVTFSGAGAVISDNAASSKNIFDLDGKNSTVTLYGTSDVVGDGAPNTNNVTLDGTSQSADMDGKNSTVTVNGNNDGVEFQGASETAYINGEGITYVAFGSSDAFTDSSSGNNTIIIEGNSDSVTAYGADDTVQTSTAKSTSIQLDGVSQTASVSGTGNTLIVAGTSNSAVLASKTTGTVTLSGTNSLAELKGTSAETITFASTTAELKLDAPSGFSGTVAGMEDGDSIDLSSFLYSGTPTISSVTGTGAAGTTTDVTITDGGVSAMLLLLNQYTNQFGVSSSAYTLTSDHTGSTPGTLFQLAAGH